MATLPCGTLIEIDQINYITAKVEVVCLLEVKVGVVCLLDNGRVDPDWWGSVMALVDDVGAFLADEDGNVLGGE